ncbi:3-oxoacyl-ACP reductase FabG [Cystobacter ferrugineus]|uniref:3-oxoacyl-ACP reductase n=1 Tax=Cystobacter ferrugineus TaxID=83449 RepID=A0A1L9B058_9BACT|nr:3-oxoacyl-ACP reductase FabG [Cystobacter ferrugineus]OJH35640.1 3-oxoacyl-ACP reductase [Cystobacter ferrugineus]
MLAESLKGKSVIVTGASKGIGKGIARVFARHGAKVLVVGRELQAAEAAAREFVSAGGTASGFSTDVTRFEDLEKMARAAAELHGGIDVLCANAGVFPQVKMEDMSPEAWDEVMATNLKGTFLSVKACIPYLKKSSQGRIVITSSITGPTTGFPGWAHYGASKAGQLGFMRTASMELARYGITVNAVLPGNIVTEGLEKLGPDYMKGMAAAVPLGKLGEVEDIGHAALFFASREAGYITGQTLIVDGGQVLPESPDALAQM